MELLDAIFDFRHHQDGFNCDFQEISSSARVERKLINNFENQQGICKTNLI